MALAIPRKVFNEKKHVRLHATAAGQSLDRRAYPLEQRFNQSQQVGLRQRDDLEQRARRHVSSVEGIEHRIAQGTERDPACATCEAARN